MEKVINILITGSCGLVSGLAYTKYSKIISIGSIGLVAGVKTLLDVNKDGKVDLEDYDQAKKTLGLDIYEIGSFFVGFGFVMLYTE